MKNYVLMLVLSPDAKSVVCLKKQNIPEHLHNKWTFPGGHIEESDASLEAAASREMAEETGLQIAPENWRLSVMLGSEARGYRLNVMTATCTNIHEAKTLTDEPVRVMDVDEALARAGAKPTEFAPDFIKLLQWTRTTVKFTG